MGRRLRGAGTAGRPGWCVVAGSAAAFEGTAHIVQAALVVAIDRLEGPASGPGLPGASCCWGRGVDAKGEEIEQTVIPKVAMASWLMSASCSSR